MEAGIFEFWFDFSSPYAYFAAQAVEGVGARHGREVVWRPFLLGVAFKATGMGPLSTTPLRGAYARRDWDRLARRAVIPFQLPANHPRTALAATRAFYWIEETAPEASAVFARDVLDAQFADGLDAADAELVAGLAARHGIGREAVLEGIGSVRIKERTRAVTEEALARGIFGSPFFIADGEPFWGHDRLAMAEEWLQKGGW